MVSYRFIPVGWAFFSAGWTGPSYAVIGTGLAWAGTVLDLDPFIFRNVGSAILGLLGLVLVSGGLQQRFASATAGIGDAGNNLISRIHLDGLWGQFSIGLILGVVWSPCVGPTLGAAVLVTSQGTNLPLVALLMGIFGIGAALPIVGLSYLSRSAILKIRGKLMLVGKTGKLILGVVMIFLSVLILSGADKPLEAWLVDQSSTWLKGLTTRYLCVYSTVAVRIQVKTMQGRTD